MKMSAESAIPSEVVEVVKNLEKAGFEAFLVGGCVRDILLGKKPKDWDITTNANPLQVQQLFPKTVYENKFGTVAVVFETTIDQTVRIIEVTPYRLESEYSDKRHPDQVSFGHELKEDLQRRDFTINAMAMSLSNSAIKDTVDLYGGLHDLKDKTIRTVGDASLRFNEDALRMMRAIRLAVELDFSIEAQTFDAIKKHADLIKAVSHERIRDELTKIIMSDRPKAGLELMNKAGLMFHVTPELEKSIGVTQNQAHKYDVWEHLLRSVQHAADKKWSLEIRLAALFHDISKPTTKSVSRETGQITFYGHEMVGSRETRKILERLKFTREITEKVVKMVRWHMFFSDTELITLSAVRRMIVNVGKDNIWDLMNLRICDRIGTGRPKEDPYRLRKYKAMVEEALRDPISLSMLKIDGKKIMEVCNIDAGPKVGNTLHILFDEVLDDPTLNTEKHLIKRAEELCLLSEEELDLLGRQGRDRKMNEQGKEAEEIRRKYGVR